ncbi:hypothetical protein AKJ16_DCAP23445 [Drosera capensis]
MAGQKRTILVWKQKLFAAIRIALAYLIVGCATVYTQQEIRKYVAYPSFSYMTATLIVWETTLGDTLRGTWHAFIGTCLVTGATVMSIWLVRLQDPLSPILAAVLVGLGTFVVALPRFIPLLSKRIALCGLVLVYVGTCNGTPETGIMMRPLYVAASTGLGAVASILAMLLPFPHLATLEVRHKCKSFVQNATTRMNLFIKAMVAEESSDALELAAEARILKASAAKLMKNIKQCQDGVLWEVPHLRLSACKYKHPADNLKEVEVTLRGMEMAIEASKCPTQQTPINQQVKDEMQEVAKQLTQKFAQIKTSLPFSAPSTPYENPKTDGEKLLPLDIYATTQQLSMSFFLFCTKYLKTDSCSTLKDGDHEKKTWGKTMKRWLPRRQDIMLATRWALSLGLATLLGLTYNKDQGNWAGLAISVSFATKRQATFNGANARAQGTALGSIYGVLGYFIGHKFAILRLAFFVPWIIFTTFLRHSKSYGEAGGISAIIAAFLILGRVGYGTPAEFGIARMSEACIGLFCYLLVEVVLQPNRAATLSKDQVSRCYSTIKGFMEQFVVIRTSDPSSQQDPLMEHEKRKMQSKTVTLREFIREAKREPNFWFKPFQSESYALLESSISRMVDLVYFTASAIELLSKELQNNKIAWKDNQELVTIDIELFKEKICSSLKYLEEETSTKPVPADQSGISSDDPEIGSARYSKRFSVASANEVELENIISTFLQHSRDIIESSQVTDNAERNKVLLCLGCIGFCMQSLVYETREAQKVVKELSRKERS